MSDANELNPQERLAVWLTVHAPELRTPYSLAEELLEPDGPLGDVLANAEVVTRVEALVQLAGLDGVSGGVIAGYALRRALHGDDE